jgi:membrane protein implicated in regulation of membrane protease activity
LVYSKSISSFDGCIGQLFSFEISFRGMKFNSLTFNISVAILVITAIYILVYSGLTGLLLCSSIALIAAAFIDQFEIVVAVSVIFALFYNFYLKRLLRRLEPFQNQDNAQSVVQRLAKMKDVYHQTPQQLKDPYLEPAGVYDPAVEGFEDVQPQVPKEGESSESKAAPTKLTTNQVDSKTVNEVTSAVKKSEKDITKEEFESATNNLFKVGKMPSENMDGPKLDSGSTLMKAMESFKPEQINAMTSDTKQLLETQKSLMSMLNQMRPVLADGKELLQTFSGMFGGGGPLKL